MFVVRLKLTSICFENNMINGRFDWQTSLIHFYYLVLMETQFMDNTTTAANFKVQYNLVICFNIFCKWFTYFTVNVTAFML